MSKQNIDAMMLISILYKITKLNWTTSASSLKKHYAWINITPCR